MVFPHDCLAHVDPGYLDCDLVYCRICISFAAKPWALVIIYEVRLEDDQSCTAPWLIVSANFDLNFVSGIPINEISVSVAYYAVTGDFSIRSPFTSVQFCTAIIQEKS